MRVHLYRWGELKRELRGAGLEIQEVLPLDEVSAAVIEPRGLGTVSVRAGGWIVFAVRRDRGRRIWERSRMGLERFVRWAMPTYRCGGWRRWLVGAWRWSSDVPLPACRQERETLPL